MKRMFKDREEFEALLDKNNVVVEHVLRALYERQIPSEQNAEQTQVHNNQGFTSFDAARLTPLAKKVVGGMMRNVPAGKRLNFSEYAFCRSRHGQRRQHMLGKYYRQISELQEDNLAREEGRLAA